MYIHVYVYKHIYIYIYICIREGERSTYIMSLARQRYWGEPGQLPSRAKTFPMPNLPTKITPANMCLCLYVFYV